MAPGLTFSKVYASKLNDFTTSLKDYPTALAIIMIPGTIISEAIKCTALAIDLVKDTAFLALSLAATVLTFGLWDRAKKNLAYYGEGLAQDLVILFMTLLTDPIQIIVSEVQNLATIGKSIRNCCVKRDVNKLPV